MNDNALVKLYGEVDKCKFCKAEKNELQHIHGFGALNPNLMLILINPTHKNLSSHPEYVGFRFPFVGVRQFWQVLADGGLINKKITNKLPLKLGWQAEHTKLMQEELIKNRIFLTNIVKCCYDNSAYPDKIVIKDQLKILSNEIKIVKPKFIVAFGALVFKTLTGNSIVLHEHFKDFSKNEIYSENISGLNYPVIPCYFPIGRGNPKKAEQILRQIQRI